MNAPDTTTDNAATMPRAFARFYLAYVEAALWSSTDDDGEPLDGLGLELSDDATARMRADCLDFFNAQVDAYAAAGWSDDQAGHDFWLTRNGHGAGFWDRGLGEAGRALTDAAHAYGDCYLYVGDNGEVYTA